MQFNTALAFVLSGLGILFFGFRHSKTSVFFSFLAGMIGLITLIEYGFDLEGGIDQLFWPYTLDYPMHYPGRMSLQTALSFTLGNLSLILLNHRKHAFCDLYAQISSALVMGLAGVSILGYLTGLETSVEWTGFSRMAIQTAVSFFVFGLAIFYLGATQSPNPEIHLFSFPIATSVLLLTGAIATWQLFRLQEYQFILKIAEKNSQVLTRYIEERLNETLQAIDRMVSRIETPNGYRETAWTNDAKNYLSDFSWIETLALFDKDLKKVNLLSEQPFDSTQFLSSLPSSIFDSLKKQEHLLIPSANKKQLFYFHPFLTNYAFGGFLFATINLPILIEMGISALQLGNYLILFSYQDSAVYTAGNALSPTAGAPIWNHLQTPYEAWGVKLYLTDDVTRLNQSTNYIILIAGAFMSMLGGLLAYFWQSLRSKKKILEAINQEWIEATQRADAANIAKSTFLATMSHEIRTPLNAVVGTVELLQETEVSSLQKRYLDRVVYASKSLLNLITDILDFSKIEGGGVVLQPVPTNLESLVKSIADALFLKATEKQIELLVEFPSQPLPEIYIDPFRFQQILSNLGNNSLKFIEKGYVLLRIMWNELDANRTTIHIEVEDTGIGISEDDQKKLFKKFSQISDQSTRKYGGVGLGLSICKKLVELMGGTIGVRSNPGTGSTFWFEFIAPIIPTSLKTYSLKNRRIFLSDSIEKERQIVNQYLIDWKGTVQQVLNPKECDMALISIDASEQIKQLQESKIPTIVICGKETVPLPDGFLGLGRPIMPRELYELFEKR